MSDIKGRCFTRIDHKGRIDLSSVDSDKLIAAVEAAGGSLDFEGWENAIKEAGGKGWR